VDGKPIPVRWAVRRPRIDRLGDATAGILGYARVSTNDQDVAGQIMRLNQAGAIKVFTDVRSGRAMDRPGLDELFAYARDGIAAARAKGKRPGRQPLDSDKVRPAASRS
jgi:DNA invertase Pin-like site-specific DNA recombinase